jgi:hypothetical protein
MTVRVRLLERLSFLSSDYNFLLLSNEKKLTVLDTFFVMLSMFSELSCD